MSSNDQTVLLSGKYNYFFYMILSINYNTLIHYFNSSITCCLSNQHMTPIYHTSHLFNCISFLHIFNSSITCCYILSTHDTYFTANHTCFTAHHNRIIYQSRVLSITCCLHLSTHEHLFCCTSLLFYSKSLPHSSLIVIH